LLVSLAVYGAACSAAPDKKGSGDGSGASGAGDNPFGNPPPPGGTGGANGGLDVFGNPIPTRKPPNRRPPTVKSSFIWIANSAEGTVSKIDTRTMMELGRYKTSAMGLGLPSRTSVNGFGDVAVANRGNAVGYMGGDGGGVTKIAASTDHCVDKNNDGKIDTSSGAMDVKPWGKDECVVWNTPINHFSNRPVAWAPPPSPDAQPMLWTSGASDCSAGACTIDVYRLKGDDGSIDAMVNITGLMGVDFLAAAPPGKLMGALALAGLLPIIVNYGAYGGASDAGGNLWLFIANTSQLVRVDAANLTFKAWATPMGNGYGITIDEKGRVFVCGALGLSRFEPATEIWTNNFAEDLGLNGCMTDGAGKIWVGGGADSGKIGLFGFDAETMALVDQVNTDQMSREMKVKGVSIDIDHNVWGVSSPGADMSGMGNIAWKFNPVDRMVTSYDGLNGSYSYSDMTGFGLEQAGISIPPT
jgi:hypothetical protein